MNPTHISAIHSHFKLYTQITSSYTQLTFNNTLLKSDVTRRDLASVVMDAGSRIVNFIRDGTVFA